MTKPELIRVALIFGGEGEERDISVISAEAVEQALLRQGIASVPIFISPEGEWYMLEGGRATELANDPKKLGSLTYPVRLGCERGFYKESGVLEVDLAIPVLHGSFGEDGRVQGALDTAGIPYLGPSVKCGAVCHDKALTKTVAAYHGIPTLDWVTATEREPIADTVKRAEAALSYPMFVKPTECGSSIGAGLARDRDELTAAIGKARVYGGVLIEKYLRGARELECGFYQIGCEQYFTKTGEISCGVGFYDYDTKYLSTDKVAIDPTGGSVEDSVRSTVLGYSKLLAQALNLCDYARIDFLATSVGEVYFNEINTIPGFTRSSMFPMLLSEDGIELGELLRDIISERIGSR